MSNFISGVVGAAAVLALGAGQIAWGTDLTTGVGNSARQAAQTSDGVNRAAKSDRSEVAPGQLSSRTIIARPETVPNTSVVMRIPVIRGGGVEPLSTKPSTSALHPIKAAGRGHQVACEPSVSVLTDIARQLPPGRCLT